MDTHKIADEQSKLWNGPAGRVWVEGRDLLDQILQPFAEPLLDAVAAAAPRRVLDVGCGTGSTTIAVARRLAGDGHVTGGDISEPMIAAARARAQELHLPASFVCADAQTHAFSAASVDLIVSRFGVMFFSDPAAAFVNLRKAVTARGALRFIAWRSAAENPFMTTAERAAAPLLPDLPPRRSDGPGQFAFGDPQRTRGILADAGWSDIVVDPLDVQCAFPERELTRYVTRLGPVGLFLQDADESLRGRVADTIRAAFEPYVDGEQVRFAGACWLVDARSGA